MGGGVIFDVLEGLKYSILHNVNYSTNAYVQQVAQNFCIARYFI